MGGRISALAVVFLSLGCGTSGTAAPTDDPAPSTPVASDQGSSTDWHLEEHELTLTNGTSTAVMADCRGNNSLSWEVRTAEGTTFPEPARVGVYCGMYAERPANDDSFHGWGWTRTNWPGSDSGCTYETRQAHGEETCNDYFRAQRDTIGITAPWCRLTFIYSEPTTVHATAITYCVTR